MERCLYCEAEFETVDTRQALCPQCDQIERAELNAAEGFYPLTRTERMRERLGVSRDVDE